MAIYQLELTLVPTPTPHMTRQWSKNGDPIESHPTDANIGDIVQIVLDASTTTTDTQIEPSATTVNTGTPPSSFFNASNTSPSWKQARFFWSTTLSSETSKEKIPYKFSVSVNHDGTTYTIPDPEIIVSPTPK